MLFGDDGILEERPRAAAIGIAFDKKHGFARADAAHSGANLSQSRRSRFALELAEHLGIPNGRSAVARQSVGYFEYNIAIFGDSIKDARAIREPAISVRKFGNAVGISVVRSQADQH